MDSCWPITRGPTKRIWRAIGWLSYALPLVGPQKPNSSSGKSPPLNHRPPLAPSALLLGGRIALFTSNRETAEKQFKSLERRFPRAAQTDSAYLERADYLYNSRLFSQAGDAYQRAFNKIGDRALKESALLGLANARRQSHQTREAIAHYDKLNAMLQPGHPAYLKAQLGRAIVLGQAGQFARAIGLFQGLTQTGDSPEAISALRELGALLQAARRPRSRG